MLSFLSFTVDNFPGERLFLANMNISLCFEAHEDCLRKISVLKNTLLPKRRCPWDVNTGRHSCLKCTYRFLKKRSPFFDWS